MRPLETHVELSSHLWMLNRVKELLIREGLISAQADDEQLRAALSKWIDMMHDATRPDRPSSH